MRSSTQLIGFTLALLGLMALPLMGCGGAKCGEGTMERDGECVLQGVSCSEGEVVHDGHCVQACGATTEMDENGNCVVAPSACKEGTSLTADTNECIVASEACTAGTALSESGLCIPSDQICADGTFFSADTGLCLPESTCRAGDIILNGICASMAEAMALDADVIANENSNPIHDGTHNSISLGGPGENTIFAGTIFEPADIKGDDGAHQYIDFYEFTAQEGDWIEITVQSTGAFTPHFTIESTDTANGVNLYRESSYFTSHIKTRQIVIPDDGTYVLTVAPEITFLDSSLLVGGPDWIYAGTIGRIETPDALAHDFIEDGSLSGSFGALDESYFLIQDEPGMSFAITLEPTSSSVVPAIQVWSSPDEYGFDSDGDFFFTLPDSGEIYFVVDWIASAGTLGLDWEFNGEEIEGLLPGDKITETFMADAGDVLEIRHTNDAGLPLQISVVDPFGELIANESVVVDTDQAFGANTPLRFIGLEAGEHIVSIVNQNNDFIEGDIDIDFNVISPEPITQFGTPYTGTGYEGKRYEQGFHLLQVSDSGDYDITITRTNSAGGQWIRGFVYGMGNDQLFMNSTNITDTLTEVTFTYNFEADFLYILRVGNESGTAVTTWWMDYEITVQPSN